MDLQLNDKVIIVTGGAKGIGEGIALKLAKEGTIPVIVGRNSFDNEKVAQVIRDQGGRAFGVTAELIHPEESKNAVEELSD